MQSPASLEQDGRAGSELGPRLRAQASLPKTSAVRREFVLWERAKPLLNNLTNSNRWCPLPLHAGESPIYSDVWDL
jgi:hypothetical protein